MTRVHRWLLGTWTASLALGGCADLLDLSDGHVGHVADAGGDDVAADQFDSGSPADSQPGDGESGGVTDAGCDADVQADPRNCGACGHDCLGGACAKGSCEPVTLAYGQGFVMGIAADGDTVVWTDVSGGRVVACRSTDCANTLVQLGQAHEPYGVAIHAGYAYWTSQGGVGRAPLAGGPQDAVSTLAIVGDADLPTGTWIAVGATGAYWTNGYGSSFNDGGAWWCADAGCGANPDRIWRGNVTTTAIAVAPTDGGETLAFVAGNSLEVCAAPSCSSPRAAGGSVAGTSSLFARDGVVFWAGTSGSATIGSLSLPNGSPVLVVQKTVEQSTSLIGPVADDARVYWGDNGTGTIYACALSPPCTAPVAIAASQNSPWMMAIGDDAIYWTNGGNGTVMKLAKPLF